MGGLKTQHPGNALNVCPTEKFDAPPGTANTYLTGKILHSHVSSLNPRIDLKIIYLSQERYQIYFILIGGEIAHPFSFVSFNNFTSYSSFCV